MKKVTAAIIFAIANTSPTLANESQTTSNVQLQALHQQFSGIKDSLFSSDFIKRSNTVAVIRKNTKILPAAIEYNINNHGAPLDCSPGYIEKIKEARLIITEYSTEIDSAELTRLQKIALAQANELKKTNSQECTQTATSVNELSDITGIYLDQTKKQEYEKAEARAKMAVEEEKKQAEQAERAKRERELLARVHAAEQAARFICNGKSQCDKAFSLTQIFINENSDMKIQLANDTLIETYNARAGSAIAARAVKLPRAGNQSEIRLTLMCDPDNQLRVSLCNDKKLSRYLEFPLYLKQNLRN